MKKKKINLRLSSLFAVLCCLVGLFFSSNIFAQTFPPLSQCTSKDLELVGATLPAPSNDPCQCSGTRTLVLTIANKTGSTRTSFALWGTLIRYDADGNQVDANGNPTTTGESIFACAATIPKTSTTSLLSNKNITISCGQSIDIVNLYLAWTSASPGETCDVLQANSSTINPKCGTLPLIHVGIGVDANFTITGATCSTGGSIKVKPFGGVGPYTVAIGSDSRTVPAGDSTTFTNLSAGDHDIIITDHRGCSVTKTRNVGSPATVTANAGDDFTKSCNSNANGKGIGETSSAGFTYSWSPTTGLSNASISNPTANPSSTITYTVTKTNTASGCSNTNDVIVTVDKPIVTANAGDDFTKTCVSNATGKQIGEVSGVGFTYSWSPSTGLSNATVSNPTANPSSTTTYTVTKTHTSSGCSDDDDVTVTVSNTKPTFTVCLVQPDLCHQYGSVTINASGGTSYTYSIDGVDFSNTTGIFNNLASGSVTSVQIKNQNGCASDAIACGALSSSCGGGIANITSPISESPSSQTTVKAYPNPFSDKVNFVVTSSVAGKGNLEVFNMMGQKVKTVYTGFISAGTQTFELRLPTQQVSNLIYVLRVGDKKMSGKILQINQ